MSLGIRKHVRHVLAERAPTRAEFVLCRISVLPKLPALSACCREVNHRAEYANFFERTRQALKASRAAYPKHTRGCDEWGERGSMLDLHFSFAGVHHQGLRRANAEGGFWELSELTKTSFKHQRRQRYNYIYRDSDLEVS